MSIRHTLFCLGLKLRVTILNAFLSTLLRSTRLSLALSAQQRTFFVVIEKKVNESTKDCYSFN
jgi:hypothetical protein